MYRMYRCNLCRAFQALWIGGFPRSTADSGCRCNVGIYVSRQDHPECTL